MKLPLLSGMDELLVRLAAVLGGLLVGGLLIMVMGENAWQGYTTLFRGALMNSERLGNTLATATPLIFTGLSVAFAFRAGLFNIGAAGQMLMGGLCASFLGVSLIWPKAVLLLVMMLASVTAGALWALLPGLLKARYNVHEVVSGIMLNWVAYWIVYYVVPIWLRGSFETESRHLPADASLRVAWLSELFDGSYINLGLLAALAAVWVTAFFLDRTVLGFELKAIGLNRHAAACAGMDAGRGTAIAMIFAGAWAGLGGMTLYCGYAVSIQIGVLPSQGFDGIAVALLGANAPWGCLAGALFMGALYSGKGFLNAMTSIPPELADTIVAVIIYFAAASLLIRQGLAAIRAKVRDVGSCGP